LGGGYPGSADSEELFDSIAKEINRALEQHFSLKEFKDIDLRVIAEPGRYYACSAYTLCTNIIAKRVMPQNKAQQEEYMKQLPAQEKDVDASKSIMYYINDGVYHSFNCLFYDHAVVSPILISDAADQATPLYKSSIWGPTCDGLDCVVKEMLLPELQQGEFMVWREMGAYTISGAVAFNGIPVPKCIYTVSHSWDIIHAFADMSDEPIVMALFDETRLNTTPTQAEIKHAMIKCTILNDDTQSVTSDVSCDSGLSSNASEVALSNYDPSEQLFANTCADEVADAIAFTVPSASRVAFT